MKAKNHGSKHKVVKRKCALSLCQTIKSAYEFELKCDNRIENVTRKLREKTTNKLLAPKCDHRNQNEHT